MAGTTVNVRLMETGGSNLETTKTVNKLVDDVETLRGALSAGGVVAVTELMADHATFKAAADAVETLVEELAVDHATFKTAVDQTETLIEELHDDHATFRTVVDDLKARVNQLRFLELYRPLGNPAFARLTNFDVQNVNAISYLNNGTLKTLAAAQTFDTGTAATFPAATWGGAALSVNSAGAGVVTWFTNAGAGYASEAAAIAAITIGVATDTPMGYVTVLAAGATWLAGTDALAGGTGGTPATTTNYYNSPNVNDQYASPAVSTSPPATLTAPKPASAPATLAASAAIPSAPATLSAAVPSGTAVDAASDLVAYKIANESGTVVA